MGRAAPATRAHEPPPHLRRLVLEGCVVVLFFSFNLGRVYESPQRYAQAKKTIKNQNAKKTPHRVSRLTMINQCQQIRDNPRKEKHTATELHRGGLAQGLAQQRVRKD